MEKIISETEVLAVESLRAFGFTDDQVNPLVTQGKKDLRMALTKLQLLLKTDTIDYDEISNVLHALKGLLFQLGNHDVADKLTESRSQLKNENTLKEIVLLLGL